MSGHTLTAEAILPYFSLFYSHKLLMDTKVPSTLQGTTQDVNTTTTRATKVPAWIQVEYQQDLSLW